MPSEINGTTRDPKGIETPLSVEHYPHGVTREWYYENRIVVFSVPTVEREAIDSWYDILKKTMAEWPVGRKWLAMHDVSHQAHMVMTPYLRAKANEIYNYRMDSLRGCIAVAAPRTFVAQLIQLFFAAQRNKRYATHLFFTRQSGLEWLKRMADRP